MLHRCHQRKYECCRFSSGNLTELFATRVFQEHATAASGTGSKAAARSAAAVPGTEAGAAAAMDAAAADSAVDHLQPAQPAAAAMDLIGFLDFLLAWEHRGTAQGLRYFWPVLDLQSRKHLDRVSGMAIVFALATLQIALAWESPPSMPWHAAGSVVFFCMVRTLQRHGSLTQVAATVLVNNILQSCRPCALLSSC